MSDMLREMMKAQRELQIKAYGADPALLEGEERIQYIKDMILAATDELHELLGETGWKPWADSDHVYRNAAVGEWIDAWHFMMNLALVLNLGPNEIFERYMEKKTINEQRQRVGYDGISTKCKRCGRALDDPSVLCTLEGCQVNV